MAHALLSPSSASRWLACTPSARLEQQFPDKAGDAAKEGTLAHSVGELILRLKLNLITKQKYSVELKKLQKDQFYNNELHQYADDYAAFVIERYAEAQSTTKDALIFLEQRLDMTKYIPEGFGTGDCLILASGVLDIIDMKYGKGVLVDAENNKQMMCYSLGALNDFGFLYDIHTVRMTIFQPRLNNFSSFEIPIVELMDWAEKTLKPGAAKAWKGEGEFKPGSHCQFCKAKAKCRALADYNLEMAKHDFKAADLLEDVEVSEILERSAAFKSWINAVEEYAQHEAVANGKKWPGFKLVEGRSNRQYTDEVAISKVLLENKFDKEKIFQPEKLITITNLEKYLSKPVFQNLVSPFVIKPPGKATLVELTDKRPELNSLETVELAFKDIIVQE